MQNDGEDHVVVIFRQPVELDERAGPFPPDPEHRIEKSSAFQGNPLDFLVTLRSLLVALVHDIHATVPTPDETDEPQNRRAEYVLAAEPPSMNVAGSSKGWKRLR